MTPFFLKRTDLFRALETDPQILLIVLSDKSSVER
jgi:hypothetical protein